MKWVVVLLLLGLVFGQETSLGADNEDSGYSEDAEVPESLGAESPDGGDEGE